MRINHIRHAPGSLHLGRILRCRVPVNSKRLSNGVGCFAISSPLCDFLTNFNCKPRSANLDALGPCSGHSGLRALTDFLRPPPLPMTKAGPARCCEPTRYRLKGEVRYKSEMTRRRTSAFGDGQSFAPCPSRLKRSSAQNNTHSNFFFAASSNRAANCFRLSAPFRPLSCSTNSSANRVAGDGRTRPAVPEVGSRGLGLCPRLKLGRRLQHASKGSGLGCGKKGGHSAAAKTQENQGPPGAN